MSDRERNAGWSMVAIASLAVAVVAAMACGGAPTGAAPGNAAGHASPAPAAAPASTTAASWNFDEDATGAVPKGWTPGETAGRGTPATWKVVDDPSAPTPPHAVAVAAENHGRTFNLLLADGTSYRDLDLVVKVKAGTGDEDRGGGPAWRAAGPDDYYVCRWNPLEDNFRLYYVRRGRRHQLAGTRVHSDPAAWHTIAVHHVGTHIVATFDGEARVEADDDTFTGPGMVGLWTKADASSFFDDVSVKPAGADAGHAPPEAGAGQAE